MRNDLASRRVISGEAYLITSERLAGLARKAERVENFIFASRPCLAFLAGNDSGCGTIERFVMMTSMSDRQDFTPAGLLRNPHVMTVLPGRWPRRALLAGVSHYGFFHWAPNGEDPYWAENGIVDFVQGLYCPANFG